jgi:hypothetical protein
VSVVTPIGKLDYRLPQAGRIRTGEQVKARSGKMRPAAIDTFKFTSGERDLLKPLADKYGGVIEAWNAPGSGDRWQVKTTATKIDVQIHVAGSVSLAYELWNPHLVRRCNGIMCQVLTGTPDDMEFAEVDCLCARRGEVECAKLLRLSVLLPGMPTLGMWRWDTKSGNSITEWLGFMRYMEEWAGNGLHECVMRIEERRRPGKVFKVVVPDYEGGVESLLAGESRLVQLPALSSPTAGELEAGLPPDEAPPLDAEPVAVGGAGDVDEPRAAGPSPASPDDEIVDAELVEDDESIDTSDAVKWLFKQEKRGPLLIRARQIATELGEQPPRNFSGIVECPAVLARLMKENQT